jgi:hypothetical protein
MVHAGAGRRNVIQGRFVPSIVSTIGMSVEVGSLVELDAWATATG